MPGPKTVDSATLGAVLESFACPALIVDPNHRVQAVNAAFRGRLGPGWDAVGAYCYEVLHGRRRPCSRRRQLCPLDASVATRTAVPAIHWHVLRCGRREEQILVKPILAADGEVSACLATLQPTAPAEAADVGVGAPFALALAPVERRLPALARSRRPLLLWGEPGTGKSCVARAVHRLRPRGGRFEERSGFEMTEEGLRALWARAEASGRHGTLYLHDVHGLGLRAQGALLDLLESDPGHRRGWRVVSGTDRPLRSIVAGGFRRALLSRLAARRLRLPPLRERADELPEIAARLLREMGSTATVLTEAALERLRGYPFPGNLDELTQALRHASLMAPGGTVEAGHLPDWLGRPRQDEP